MPPSSKAISPTPEDDSSFEAARERTASERESDTFFNDGPIDALMPLPPARDVRSMWLRPLLSLGLLGAVYVAGAWAGGRSSQPPPVGPFVSQNAAAKPVVVHVAGRVKHPGVYALPSNARIEDALQKAGGVLPDADANALNLAAWAEDGQKIEVPAKAAPLTAPRLAAAPIEAPPAIEAQAAPPQEAPRAEAAEPPVPPPVAAPPAELPAMPPAAPQPRAVAAPRSSKSARPSKIAPKVPTATTPSGQASTNASPDYLAKHPVNLNTATTEQLQLLPGVGPKMAEKIIEYRRQTGGFKTIDDLDEVKGIGEKTLEKLRPLVTVQ